MTKFEENGLLPVIEDEHEWLRPTSDAFDDDPIGQTFRLIADHKELERIIWPARIDGDLRRPPDEHILDQLVREEFEGASGSADLGAFSSHPSAWTVGVVLKLPACNLCNQAGARYDAKMSTSSSGAWANMCPRCYLENTDHQLGVGLGQYLLQHDEIPEDVTRAQAIAQAYWRERIDRD